MTPTAEVNSPKPQKSAKKIATATFSPKSEQTTPAAPTSDLTPLRLQIPSVNAAVIETPQVALPEVESPSPATKIFAAESAKFKNRRTRNKKVKVPASPSPTKETKGQAAPTPRWPSSDFDFRVSPSKQALVQVNATVPLLGSAHNRSVSDSSSMSSFSVAGRSRGDSSSSSDEDKPSTGKTTPHRLSEASESDKPLDLFPEYAPSPIVEADLTSLEELSFTADVTAIASMPEVVTADTPVEEQAVSPSAEEALLAAVANDTSPAFFKRITSRRSSRTYEELLPTHLSTFGKTVIMVKQMVNASDVAFFSDEDEAHNIKLVDSLDVYHYSTLPKMVLSTDQAKEQAAFDLAMLKHRDDLMRHAAQEAAAKVPQTKADAQMSALFAIGIQSLEKNGTLFFNPKYKPCNPVEEEVLDVEQDPAIVSMVTSLSSGTGLAATLTRLGPNRPFASWYKSSMPATSMARAPADGLDALIVRMRAREAAKLTAIQPTVSAPIVHESSIEAVSSMKNLPMDKYFTHGFSGADLAEEEESFLEAPMIEEPFMEASKIEETIFETPTIEEYILEAVKARAPAPIVPIAATKKAQAKASKPAKASKTVAKLTGPRTRDSLSKKEKRAMKKAGLL